MELSRHEDWLRQAENDIEWARHSLDGKFFAQACFVSQQAAEKAVKAYCYFRGFDEVRSHSLVRVMEAAGLDGPLRELAKELDIYYIAGRYPDAYPAGAPFELISREQAERALHAGDTIVNDIRARMEEGAE